MGFDNTLGTDPLGTVHLLIILAVPLISSITSETRMYCCINQNSACHWMFCCSYLPVHFIVTPHNLASLSYVSSFTFLFLGIFSISQIYSSPGYISLQIFRLCINCVSNIVIQPPRICIYSSPRFCIHNVVKILNSPLNLCYIHAQIHLYLYHQYVCLLYFH